MPYAQIHAALKALTEQEQKMCIDAWELIRSPIKIPPTQKENIPELLMFMKTIAYREFIDDMKCLFDHNIYKLKKEYLRSSPFY